MTQKNDEVVEKAKKEAEARGVLGKDGLIYSSPELKSFVEEYGYKMLGGTEERCCLRCKNYLRRSASCCGKCKEMASRGIKGHFGELGNTDMRSVCDLFAPIPNDGLVVYTQSELRELLRWAILLGKNTPYEEPHITNQAESIWAGFDEQRKLLDGDWRKHEG